MPRAGLPAYSGGRGEQEFNPRARDWLYYSHHPRLLRASAGVTDRGGEAEPVAVKEVTPDAPPQAPKLHRRRQETRREATLEEGVLIGEG